MSKAESLPKLVIITGCQRSGTSLVGQIIGAHPNALLLDENEGLMDWAWALLNRDSKQEELFCELISKAAKKYQSDYPKISEGRFKKTKLLPHITHLVLKAPNLTYFHREIAALERDVAIVNPVRDVRAVVASMEALETVDIATNQLRMLNSINQETGRYGREVAFLNDPANPPHLKRTLVWQIKTTAFQDYGEAKLDPLVFRYEDCVGDPIVHAKRIADHVGLAFVPEMAEHSRVLRGRGPGQLQRDRPIDAASLDKWRNRLTDRQEREILIQSVDAMRSLGYEIPESAMSAANVQSVVPSRDDPIIVTGRGGSGTRLMSNIVQECGVFLGNRFNKSADSLEWVDPIYAIAKAAHSASFEPSDAIADEWRSGLAEAANQVLATGGVNSGQRWGFKLPESMLIMPQLLEVFPNAKIIHLIRHPVTSSIRRTHVTSRTNNPVGEVVCEAAYRAAGRDPALAAKDPDWKRNALTWEYQVSAVAKIGRTLASTQYHEIKFEDLCETPQLVASDVAAFLGSEPPAAKAVEISKRRANRWLGFGRRKKQVWKICRETAEKLGYQPL